MTRIGASPRTSSGSFIPPSLYGVARSYVVGIVAVLGIAIIVAWLTVRERRRLPVVDVPSKSAP